MWWERHALRKNNLRVDLRVYPTDPEMPAQPAQAQGAIMSLINAAIMRGLDVVGIVTPNDSFAGQQAQQIVQRDNLDLQVVPGQDYRTADDLRLVAYKLPQPLPPGLSAREAVERARQGGGWTMAYNVSRSNTEKMARGGPDAIEIYNDQNGGYEDIDVRLPKLVSSGAPGPADLEKSRSYTSLTRAELEGWGLLPKGKGIDYVPNFLRSDVLDSPTEAASPLPVGLPAPAAPQVAPAPAPNGGL